MKLSLLLGLFFVLIVIGSVSAESDYCCEKTIEGNWCQNTLESSCDNNYRKAPTSCETTSYCNVGTCTDAQGVCVENTPNVLCENQNGIWEDKVSCEEEQSFCTDSDGGIVFGVEGETSKNGVTKIDSCDDADGDGIKERLLEYYCGDSLYPSVLLGICSGECSDGVCIQEEKIIDEVEELYCCERTIDGASCQTSSIDKCDVNFRKAPTSCETTSYCIQEEKIIDEVEELYCCEKTIEGNWCQNTLESSCDNNYRKAPTSCETTSYCISGICIKEGTCIANTPKVVCESDGGFWSQDSFCIIKEIGEIIIPTEETGPIVIPTEEISPVCNGCELNDKCYPFNYRTNRDYCDVETNDFVKQVFDGKCNNNFECKSNLCIDSQCIEEGFFKRIINWFRNLFGG